MCHYLSEKREIEAFERMMRAFRRMTSEEHLRFAQERGVRDKHGDWVKLKGHPAVSESLTKKPP